MNDLLFKVEKSKVDQESHKYDFLDPVLPRPLTLNMHE